jgi:hypothetical protein
MATIIVKTQKELDALPDSFKEFTYIEIRSDSKSKIFVTENRGSSQVRAYGSSQVRAYGSSQVTAYGSSQVTAYDSSRVTAYDSSQVTACGSSQVRAYGSSQVTAYGSSQVRAFGNSMIAVLSAYVVLHKIAQYAIVALDGVKIKLPKKAKTATVINRKLVEHDINSFIDFYGLTVNNKAVILYKSVDPKTLLDFKTGTIKYEGIVKCPDFDPSSSRECGGGLHLCATPELTQTFNVGKILKCRVLLKDIVVYGKDIKKVRCRKVEVLEDKS